MKDDNEIIDMIKDLVKQAIGEYREEHDLPIPSKDKEPEDEYIQIDGISEDDLPDFINSVLRGDDEDDIDPIYISDEDISLTEGEAGVSSGSMGSFSEPGMNRRKRPSPDRPTI